MPCHVMPCHEDGNHEREEGLSTGLLSWS
jgi:hypothetical protein